MKECTIEQIIIELNEHLNSFCNPQVCDECKLCTKNGKCLKNKAQEKLNKIIAKLYYGEE